jgi:hypothetical protein
MLKKIVNQLLDAGYRNFNVLPDKIEMTYKSSVLVFTFNNEIVNVENIKFYTNDWHLLCHATKNFSDTVVVELIRNISVQHRLASLQEFLLNKLCIAKDRIVIVPDELGGYNVTVKAVTGEVLYWLSVLERHDTKHDTLVWNADKRVKSLGVDFTDHIALLEAFKSTM